MEVIKTADNILSFPLQMVQYIKHFFSREKRDWEKSFFFSPFNSVKSW